MKAKLYFLEHFVTHSLFLFGLFMSVVDYLHATPLPPQYAHQTIYFGAVLSTLDFVGKQWKQSVVNDKSANLPPSTSSSPSSASTDAPAG